MNAKKILAILLIAGLGAFVGAFVFSRLQLSEPTNQPLAEERPFSTRFTSIDSGSVQGSVDFTMAAEVSVNAVVHVKTVSTVRSGYQENPLYEFFHQGAMRNPNRLKVPVLVLSSATMATL